MFLMLSLLVFKIGVYNGTKQAVFSLQIHCDLLHYILFVQWLVQTWLYLSLYLVKEADLFGQFL